MSAERSDGAQLAVGYWAIGWVTAQFAALLVISAAGSGSDGTDIPIPLLGVATLVSWSVLVVMLVVFSRRVGTGSFLVDFQVSAKVGDALFIPVGVFIQLVTVPLLYAPLRSLWPDTFSDARIQDNARDLVDRAGGFSTIVLILMVVIGAPIVEELVYRGFLQRWLATRFTRIASWLVVAGLFTAIHLRPVEYPGLALFALAVGAAMLVTGRIGAPIALHVGFNAAGILLAF
ncbi:MAG: CPBP family intramembrane glutamic endopeptidase [Ilumatobacter sp.]